MKISFYTAMLLAAALALVQPGYAAMQSANFSIPTSVMSGGGGSMSSAGFRVNHTLGQTVASDPVSSAGYDLYAGFWYTLVSSGCIWDLEPDGDVDGFDLYQFINPPYNASDIEGFGSEFGRTDCFD